MSFCVVVANGAACINPPTITDPVALCQPHQLAVALSCVPSILESAFRSSDAEGRAETLIRDARPVNLADHLDGVHDQVVYFIANGNKVKIGFTANLRSRLRQFALRSSSVLLLLSGGPDLERALHTRFARHRDGSTEWFDLCSEIVDFVGPHRSPGVAEPAPSTEMIPSALIEAARQLNAKAITETGQTVSIRQLKTELKIGQPRAQAVQRQLRGVGKLTPRQRSGAA